MFVSRSSRGPLALVLFLVTVMGAAALGPAVAGAVFGLQGDPCPGECPSDDGPCSGDTDRGTCPCCPQPALGIPSAPSIPLSRTMPVFLFAAQIPASADGPSLDHPPD
jgi:hypothetical protein